MMANWAMHTCCLQMILITWKGKRISERGGHAALF